MNRKRLLLIGVLALALGAVVSFQVYDRLQAKVAPARTDVDVVVAADDIQVGARIGDHDLKVVKYPPENLPPRAFHTKTSLVGRGVVLPIGKGEFITPEKLSDAGTGLSAMIAVGMRAVAVRVNDVTAVSGFVVSGTRVDVLVTGTPTGSSEPQTITILQDVRVLAAGHERTATGEPQNATVVTLQVSPEDSEKLALASQEGRIQLVLRNLVDTNQEKPAAVRKTTLFGGAVSQRPVKVMRVKPAPTQDPEPLKLDIDVIRGTQKETIHLLQ
jgi:pilus assembly protein CpaB